MGTIKIGSSANRKGITVNPSVVLFNGSNVKKIMSGLTTIWEDIKPLVPIMTSDTTPYGQAIATNQYQTYSPYKAFDGDEYTGGTINYPGSVGYKFTTPTCIKKVYIRLGYHATISPEYAPKNIVVQASNDGNSWTDLYTFDNTAKNEYVDVTFDNDKYYLYYRCYSASGNGGAYISFITLQFYGSQLVGLVPTMTSNTTPSGVASASFETGNYAPWKAFNGTTTDHNDAWIAMGTSSAWIQYQFTNPTIANKVSITNRNYENTCAIKNFTVQGSNNGSTWTDLGSFVKSDGANNFEMFSFNNNTAYLYYRISVKDIYGTDAGIGELQFYK